MKIIAQKLLLRTLAGIEFNIEVLVLILLWINNYKIAFWILLVLSIWGSIIKLKEINKLAEEKKQKLEEAKER